VETGVAKLALVGGLYQRGEISFLESFQQKNPIFAFDRRAKLISLKGRAWLGEVNLTQRLEKWVSTV